MHELLDNDRLTLKATLIKNNKIKIRIDLKPVECVGFEKYETIFNVKEDRYPEEDQDEIEDSLKISN